MKQFYQFTYYFGVVTKCIFAIVGFISTIGILRHGKLTAFEKMVNFFGLCYVLLLVADVICSFNAQNFKWLKYMNGIMSIVLGIVISVVLMSVEVISVPLTLLFVVWILLLGVFDLLRIERKVLY